MCGVWGRGFGYDMAGGCFTNYVLHSLKNYHQEHATELRRLLKDVVAAWGSVFYVSAELPVCACSIRWSVCSVLEGHVDVAWKLLRKQCAFWKSGFKFAFGRNKKGKVFGILSQLKKLSTSNYVHAQNIFSIT